MLKLKEQGHHHTEKGKFLMDSFLEQINNRLSTTVKPRVNRGLFISQAKIMLQGPSNYEKVGGKPVLYQKKKMTYI